MPVDEDNMVYDIDANDFHDVGACAEYVTSIYEHLAHREVRVSYHLYCGSDVGVCCAACTAAVLHVHGKRAARVTPICAPC